MRKEKKELKEYWNSLLTEKSWQILQELKRSYNFILIGGWAVYLFTRQQKSKDIDIVVDLNELQKLKRKELSKNDNLKKYEIKNDEVDIDIYVEYYSKLVIPVEDIKKYKISLEGFDVIGKEALVLLKQSAFRDRKNSIKGEKDRIDIVSLVLLSEFDLDIYMKIANKYNLNEFFQELKQIILNYNDFDVIGLIPQELKKKKNEFILRWRKIKTK